MSSINVLYSYLKWHKVSFTLVAEKHIKYMREVWGYKVYEIDELQFPTYVPVTKYTAVVHPAFYIMNRVLESRKDIYGRFRKEYYDWWRSNYKELVGIDVCDSDMISEFAVALANLMDKVVVPSKYCVEVFTKSGVKSRVYWVPHGLDPEWYTIPNLWDTVPPSRIHPALIQLYLYKVRKGKKIILFWLRHSPERKGWFEVRETYVKLRKLRDDVILVLKTGLPNTAEYQQVMDLGAINIYGWLTEADKMALYDLADITLMFSRGGSFELNCLESLGRGVPCIASDVGSWTEYVPPFLQVKHGRRVQPLPGNRIHVGYGYAVDVDSAVEKINDVLDNLQEYRAKVLEWRDSLKNIYRWDIIAKKLIDVMEG